METLLPVGDVELCVDTAGSPTDIPLLLIGTTVATWDDELVERLTGRFASATTCRTPADRPPSTPTRPATSCATWSPTPSVYSTGSASPAHTSWASRPAVHRTAPGAGPPAAGRLARAGRHPPGPAGPVDHDLPGHSPAIMAYFSSAPPVDWPDRTSILDGAVAAARVFSGSPQFDAAEAAPTRPVFSTAPVRTRRRRATAC